MGFWKSVKHKAKKEYRCAYCGVDIKIGELYTRETGIYGGGFNDYCLCERCKKWINSKEHRKDTDELGSLLDDLVGNDMLNCGVCGSYDFKLSINKDRTVVKLICRECKEETEVDITSDGLSSLMQRK